VIDQPGVDEPEIFWWQPGANGSLLLVGSPRSGVRWALDTVIRGAVERFAADDLQLYVIDPNESRRDALSRFEHLGRAAAPDAAHVDAIMFELDAELERRRSVGDFRLFDGPSQLLVVRNVEALRPGTVAALAALAGGGAFGINVIAGASRYSDVSTLVERFPQVLVGGLSDVGDYERFGLDEPASVAQHPGRCIRLGDRRLVQLATNPSNLGTLLGGAADAAIHAETDERFGRVPGEQHEDVS
jgi:hypothetical protein